MSFRDIDDPKAIRAAMADPTGPARVWIYDLGHSQTIAPEIAG